jgi:hypothetical protein
MDSFEPLAETMHIDRLWAQGEGHRSAHGAGLAPCMRDLADVCYAKTERNPGGARPSLDALARPNPTHRYLRGRRPLEPVKTSVQRS